jgi:aspartate racemase
MRKIGLIGGMSWYSTEFYYRRLNKQVQKRANMMCSAPMVLDNLNFCDLAKATTEQDWSNVAKTLIASAKRLEKAGATTVLIGANSMHKVYDDVAEAVSVPVIHIADAVGQKMKADGVKSAALIGTRNVMAESWYRQRLVKHGVTLLPWEVQDVDQLERIIYEELMAGQIVRNSERILKTLLTEIDKDGADAVVLGCTELGMIVDTKANILPIYDSAEIHVDAAVEWIFGDAP